ncbi:MAG TPA: glycosyltransferase [Pirellulaceae bacterium]|nr:glycosyltransferase [Pirellulaceae bacterium]
MSPLRIALVITELEVGGAEQALVRLATGLDRARFTPVVYSLAPLPTSGQDQLVCTLAEAGIEVHSLGARHWWHFPAAVRKLAGLLTEQQPQVVQTFLFHANVVGVLAARQAKIPHVLMGIRVADPNWWRGGLERALASRGSGVVCVSQSVADFCRQKHKFPAGKLVVIPNGIDADDVSRTVPIDPEMLGIPAGRKLLTFIGRLDRQKDPGWLLKIAQTALPQLPDHDLVIVGEGPLRRGIEESIAASPHADRLHLVGWRGDALSVLAESQMLLLTSQHEGMPNVVLEAMALGKPVMASRVEGVVELLGPAAVEQTAAWRDTEVFVQQLVALARDPARCEQLGQVNQARAREHFSIERKIAVHAQLYEGLTGS